MGYFIGESGKLFISGKDRLICVVAGRRGRGYRDAGCRTLDCKSTFQRSRIAQCPCQGFGGSATPQFHQKGKVALHSIVKAEGAHFTGQLLILIHSLIRSFHTFVNTIFKLFYNRYNNRTVLTLELTFVLKSIFQKCCLVNSCINNRMKSKENACIYKRPFKRKSVNTSVITSVYTIMPFDSRIPEGNTFRG